MLGRFRKSSQRFSRGFAHGAAPNAHATHGVQRRLLSTVDTARALAGGAARSVASSASAAAGAAAGGGARAGGAAAAGAGASTAAWNASVRRALSLVAAGSLAATGVALATHNQRTARAEPGAAAGAGAGAVLAPAPAVAAPAVAAAAAPGAVGVAFGVGAAADAAERSAPQSGRLRTLTKRGGSAAGDAAAPERDPIDVDPHAPTFGELGAGRNVTEFMVWNGADIKLGYSPTPGATAKDVQIMHHIALGSPLSKEDEPTASYDLNAIFADNESNVLRAVVSAGGVDAMAKHTFTFGNEKFNHLDAQIQAQMPGDDQHPNTVVLEGDWKGRGYTVDLSYRSQPSVAQVAFVQNIPLNQVKNVPKRQPPLPKPGAWRSALGVELGHAFDSQNTALSYAGRVQHQREDGSEQWSFNVQTWAYGILSYQRRFADPNQTSEQEAMELMAKGLQPPPLVGSVTLASDLHYNMSEHVAMVSGGVEYKLPNVFTAKAMVNSNVQVSSVLELEMAPQVKVSVCGDVRHSENKYQFGLGLQLGGR